MPIDVIQDGAAPPLAIERERDTVSRMGASLFLFLLLVAALVAFIMVGLASGFDAGDEGERRSNRRRPFQ